MIQCIYNTMHMPRMLGVICLDNCYGLPRQAMVTSQINSRSEHIASFYYVFLISLTNNKTKRLHRMENHLNFLQPVQKLGHLILYWSATIGRSLLTFLATMRHFFSIFTHFRLLLKQLYQVGVLSVSIILVSGLFVGMVLALQGYDTLVDFGAEESLGVVVALSLVRELAPVVSALLFAGRAGSALSAEIGLMKATEQLSALEMMAVNPKAWILLPRLLAGMISLPLLTALFSLVGVYGGFLVGSELLGVDSGAYWGQIEQKVDLNHDLFSGMIKSLVFALVTTWIALFEGYDCVPTSAGISRATTNTVVYSSLAVLALDFLLTAIML